MSARLSIRPVKNAKVQHLIGACLATPRSVTMRLVKENQRDLELEAAAARRRVDRKAHELADAMRKAYGCAIRVQIEHDLQMVVAVKRHVK